MSGQERKPIDIAEVFPVGKEFLLYCQDGMFRQWGRWSAIVRALDLDKEIICLEMSQDWEGADTRGGQHWSETRTIHFGDFIIPTLLTEEARDLES